MKTNAIIRIIIWSLVLVLLLGILSVGLFRPGQRLSEAVPVEKEVPISLTEIPRNEAPAIPDEEPQLNMEATVNATAVNVRSAPNSDSSTVGMLEQNDSVVITRRESVDGEGWAYITSPISGWVKAEFLDLDISSPAPMNSDISLDPRQIKEIDIEWAEGNIIIESADVDSIQFSEAALSKPKYAMVWKQSGDKLTIRYSENIGLDFNFGITVKDVVSKDLTILVPIGWECDSLEVDAASATLGVKNMVIEEVDFDGASGVCTFENCVIDKLDLDTASGDIYFTGSLKTLDCDAASASVIAVFDNVPSRIDMDSMSGDLDITLPSSAGFTVTMDALSSDFVSDFGYSQRNGSYYRGDGKCQISMDAMSGDVYLRENQEAAAAPAAHHHTEDCTANPESCPDNSTHHTESHHK